MSLLPSDAGPSGGGKRLRCGRRDTGGRRSALDRDRLCHGRGRRALRPGLDLFGLSSGRLLVLRVPRPADVLSAMEDALRCRALGCVIAELTGEGAEADLTATRRLALAAPGGGERPHLRPGACSIRHRATAEPSAAATRWEIAAAPSLPDRPGAACQGLGRTRFRPFASQEPARSPPAGGSSSGTIMSVSSSQRFLSVWLRRLSTDRIARLLPAQADASKS